MLKHTCYDDDDDGVSWTAWCRHSQRQQQQQQQPPPEVPRAQANSSWQAPNDLLKACNQQQQEHWQQQQQEVTLQLCRKASLTTSRQTTLHVASKRECC